MPIPQRPLSTEELTGIVLAVQSAFTKLRNLYERIQPIFESFGFDAPSAGVIARDLSEKIEASIVQHCPSFSKGQSYCDLQRDGAEWEVKVCKDSGLTINQSKIINGENYVVVNYKAGTVVVKVWVLWGAQDHHFSPRRSNSNARALRAETAASHIQVLHSVSISKGHAQPTRAPMAKAALPSERRAKAV